MVACMTALLGLGPGDHVLEIGTGSGYQTAVLSGLCGDVVSVECQGVLHERARACLLQLGYQNVRCVHGDGSLGYGPAAPYDGILVTAGSPRVPRALVAQLKEGGRLVCPVGDRKKQQLLKLTKKRGEIVTTSHTNCIFVPLVGADGWPVGDG
jgi:protein-L-isoaspartate(D-aspartate) O-methyltransferase